MYPGRTLAPQVLYSIYTGRELQCNTTIHINQLYSPTDGNAVEKRGRRCRAHGVRGVPPGQEEEAGGANIQVARLYQEPMPVPCYQYYVISRSDLYLLCRLLGC